MSVLKTAWANLQDGLGNRFSWSHVKAIFYNYAEQKLLSTKLDEMDALIDEKIAKAMMSNVQVNDQTKVPTSALAYSMSQDISQNAQDITQLNSDLDRSSSALDLLSGFQPPDSARVPLTVKRAAGLIVIIGHFRAGTVLDDWTPITTLPSGYRPSKQLRIRQISEAGKSYTILIGPDGAVQLYNASSISEGDVLFIGIAF